ncbi:MAG: hypothetical protein ABR569_05075 [Gaiellaceae bacterium]
MNAAARSHLDDTVRSWLGVPRASAIETPVLPEALARRLLRAEEYEQAHRDQWGCWEFGFCESFREGRLLEPDIDRWVAERRAELAGTAELEPLWPTGRRFAICMTHDVDLLSRTSTPRQALRSLRTSITDSAATPRQQIIRLVRPGVRAARAAYNGISTTPAAEMLERSVQIERDRGVTASYFFTAYPGAASSRYDCTYGLEDPCRFRGKRMRVADVLRTLDDEGFDVGLHGSYNSALVPGMLAREKASLESATGLAISTTRQHFIHWDVRITPHLQADAGLTADSTLGFNRSIGFRAGTSLPHRHFDIERGARLNLLQVPLLVHDGALLRPDALELDVELATDVIRTFVDRAAELGGLATMIFHPNNIEREDYLELFTRSIEYGLERGGWFASLRDVDRWWREREARLEIG